MGSIPPELGGLSNLTRLSLYRNQLSGSVPPELGDLSNLEGLSIGGNQLSGSIPPELSDLSNLTWLDLSSNELGNNIPPELGNLSNLAGLFLEDNQLNGDIPPELGSLSNLRGLVLHTNLLSSSIPLGLSNLSNLSWLDLSDNKLGGSIPPELGGLSNLRWLYVDHNELTGSIPSELGNLTSLSTLRVENNALEGDIPSSFVNLTNLNAGQYDTTALGYNKLTFSDPAVVTFLDDKDPDWDQTQTVAPTDLQVAGVFSSNVELSWSPIPYTGDDGYYEVSYATTSGGPYTVHGSTSNKTAAGYTADNLSTDTLYYFVVRTHTPAHGLQQNDLWSEYSTEKTATTSSVVTSQISPTEGGQVSSPTGDTQVTFPGGAVDSTTTVTYTQQTTPTQETGTFRFAGNSFQLEATDADGDPVIVFNESFTITLQYDDADWQNAGAWPEESLNLAYWDDSAATWVDLRPCAGCAIDTTNNVLTVVLDHLTEFAMLGERLVGDVDGNCTVDGFDLETVVGSWREDSVTWPEDCNGDGEATVEDIMCTAAHWNDSCSSAP